MNSYVHAGISARKYKTENKDDFDWFERLHSFMDCSKEVESSNTHRILSHHMWYVKRVIIPIYGSYKILNGSTLVYNTKDDMESSHIAADFKNKFLPTLSDYFFHLHNEDYDEEDTERFKSFREDNKQLLAEYPNLEELLLSPLGNTGWVKSLWLTHNSWFIHTILPLIPEYSKIQREIRNYKENSPSIFLNRIDYALWMQNGAGLPPSYEKIGKFRDRAVVSK